ncbi:MAG: 50S ribosomal protein L10 [Chloroflexota bacterium]|nr:50S ribosomal protein L10 [Chloroflexota bacterium]
MHKDQKKEVVTELADRLSRCKVAISTDYRGLPVVEMTELRRRLRQRQVEYRVIKNTLARFAAEDAGRTEFTQIVEGPTAVAFGYDDITEPAKALLEYIRSSGSILRIRGGLVNTRVLSAAEVTSLATMPPKEVLLAQVLGGMKGPIVGLVNVLNANLTALVYVLDARVKQLEGGSSD